MKYTFLSKVAAILAIISSSLGLFYSFGGKTREVTNIYGETVTLFGDGIYYNDSLFKVSVTKGTDLAVIIVAVALLLTLFLLKEKKYGSFIQAGLLSILLYATTCLVMGTVFNDLFLLYVVQFSFTFFAFTFTLIKLLNEESFKNEFYEKKLTKTAIFLIISGLSVLQWLAFIIPTLFSDNAMEIIDIYATEPTFIIDLGIILPTALYCAVMLLKKKPFAYQLAPVLLILLSGVALCVIGQTILQSYLGVVISLAELVGLVIVFIILGIVSLVLNFKILKHLKG